MKNSYSTHEPLFLKMIKKLNDHKVLNAAHLIRSRARARLGCIRFSKLAFSVTKPESMFWQLLPAPVVGCEVYPMLPITGKKLLFDEKKNGSFVATAGNARQRNTTRDNILVQFWTSHVRGKFAFLFDPDKDGFSLLPWQSWTESADGDLKMNKVLRFEPRSRRVCGSATRRLFVMARSIWKHSESRKTTRSWKPPFGFVDTVNTTTIGCLKSHW